ncbi:MAG: hypothetical protein Q9159_003883 [Coniocarpon cinnabarinum]
MSPPKDHNKAVENPAHGALASEARAPSNDLLQRVSKLQQDMNKGTQAMDATETKVKERETALSRMRQDLKTLKDKVGEMTKRVDAEEKLREKEDFVIETAKRVDIYPGLETQEIRAKVELARLDNPDDFETVYRRMQEINKRI